MGAWRHRAGSRSVQPCPFRAGHRHANWLRANCRATRLRTDTSCPRADHPELTVSMSSSAAVYGSSSPATTRLASSGRLPLPRISPIRIRICSRVIASISARARNWRRRSRSPDCAIHSRCWSSVATTSSIPSPFEAIVRTIGAFQIDPSRSRREPKESMYRRSRTVWSAPSRSALFTTKMSATSRIPAFAAWIPSPIPGASRTIVVSASETTSISDCPTPTVSTNTTSQPAASSTLSACGVAQDSPPRWPRVAIDRMNTPLSVACSCIRTRSPSKAPPENGEDGSTARTPTRLPCLRRALTSADVDVDLPTPGDPVSPTTWARPVCGASAVATSRSLGLASSTIEISRATALGSLSCARATRSETLYWRGIDLLCPIARSAGRRHVEHQGVSLPAAPTQRRHARAATPATQLQREVQRDARARHPDRMAQGDSPSVDVDFLRIHAEFASGDEAHRGECLVDLEQIQVGGLDPLLAASRDDRVRRLLVQARVGARDDAVCADLGQPAQPQLLSLGLAHHHDRGGAVGDLRGGPGSDGAIGGEGGAKPRQPLGGGLAPHAFVRVHDLRVALALRHGDWRDLLREQPFGRGLRGPLVRAGGELVLILAGQLEARVEFLGRCTHRALVESAEQTVVRHVVQRGHLAELVAFPRLRQQVRSLSHRLLPARDDDVELARTDQLVGQGDGVDSGQAHLVDRQSRDAHRDSAGHGSLPRRDLPGAGGQDLAHDHVLHLIWAHASAFQGSLDRHSSELRSREVLQRAEHPAHRGARTGNDHGLRHNNLQRLQRRWVAQTIPAATPGDRVKAGTFDNFDPLHSEHGRAARNRDDDRPRGDRRPRPRRRDPVVRGDARPGRHPHRGQRGAGRPGGHAQRSGRQRRARCAAARTTQRSVHDRQIHRPQRPWPPTGGLSGCRHRRHLRPATGKGIAPALRGAAPGHRRLPGQLCPSERCRWCAHRARRARWGAGPLSFRVARNQRHRSHGPVARTYPPVAFGIPSRAAGRDPPATTHRRHGVQEIRDAILADELSAIGGLDIPDHYRGVTVRADEVEMFAGLPTRDKDPRKSLHLDDVPTPDLGPGEAIVAVMASAINYNTVWTSIFEPLPTFSFLKRYGRLSPLAKRHDLPYHVVGSDLAGVVLRTGPGVHLWKPGDEVVAHCLSVELESSDGHNDTMMDPEQRIWGFETNFGGLAELALVKSNQLMPKPTHLTWEEAASPGLVNSTAYRQLVSRNGADMKQGDTVLIWGASGGLGSYATQFALNGGAIPVCIVSSDDKADLCRAMGAELIIDRRADDYRFWKDETTQDPKEWKRFGGRIRELN